jgi:hypothetical protein
MEKRGKGSLGQGSLGQGSLGHWCDAGVVESVGLNWGGVCQLQFLQGEVMEKREKGSLGQGSLGQGLPVWGKAEVGVQEVGERWRW